MQSDQNDLRNIMHHLRTITSQIKPVKDITFGEYTVLCVISKMLESKPETLLTPTKLNEILGTKKPATSRTLTMLERKGYIARKTDSKDHRIAYLMLTTLGEEMLLEEAVTYKKLTERIVERMGREELAYMLSAMGKFRYILEEEVGNI